MWCASQHDKVDPTKPASKWDTAWRALRDAAGLKGFRFHDLRHTVVTDLLEAGEPEHVIEAVTRHLSRRMLEHYSHQRLKAKGQMLVRMEERRKKGKVSSWTMPSLTGDYPTLIKADNQVKGGSMPSSYAVGDHFERFIKDQVEGGRYASASEVVRDALRLLEEQERMRLVTLDVLREEIRKGLGSGAAKPADEVLARLESKYAAMARKRRA